ncbi:PREDICTED: gamma-interferon-inducible protein 16 [Rhinopithecus bieti]|uniref:Interferon gamma inducible protein 16 n=1 Tax=Rhinopithecus bieti TaxID=61621 RepID=A0AAJ7HL69_RHIBE|nr:PREDICTED: gamma-interferon-inducible protein 16 [Rhinopithecus bieti]XP_017731012.1 PREDICTED: gamma-interferon-inducible protein 16 [Rhinopithecus bieti]
MEKKYKNIVLLKGLEVINDYHFRMVKSLLSNDLKLNVKMREEYDKIQIADLMEEKFRGDAGLGKLIQIFKDIPTLEDLAETLRKEKLKAKQLAPSRKRKKGVDPASPAPSTSGTVNTEGVEATPGAQKRKKTTKEKAGTKGSKMSEKQTQPSCPAGAGLSAAMGRSPPPKTSSSAPPNTSSAENPKTVAKCPVTPRRNILQKGPMIVKVLSTTKPFEYETPEMEKKIMFHATVATPTQFFHVKVLNTNLKEKFNGKKIIVISDYLEYDSLLEVNEESSVSEAGPNQMFEVPNKIINRAKETLKTDILHKQASGNIVYGIFMLHKKTVNQKTTIYEVQDDRGKMDVVGTGQCHNIPCEEGDKLQLYCFRLRKKNQMSKLISEMHSFIQVKKKTNPRNNDPKSMKLPQEQSQVPNPSEASKTFPESHLQTPQMPPTTPSSSFFIKKSEDTITKMNDLMRMQILKEKSHFPGPFMTSIGTAESHPHTPQMPPSTPSSSFLTTLKPRLKIDPKEVSIEDGVRSDLKEVMVLNATESFVYEPTEQKKMFHATVATENEVFRVKVFNIDLKEKFTPKKIIAISNYVCRSGFLEVYPLTVVVDVNADRKMEIPQGLIRSANITPKISYLRSQTKGSFVNGVFAVHKKNVRGEFTYYEIQDNTGKMEVVVHGRLTTINCEEGDKLKLTCFELAPKSGNNGELRSVIHSHIKVIKARKNKKDIFNPDSSMETSTDFFF